MTEQEDSAAAARQKQTNSEDAPLVEQQQQQQLDQRRGKVLQQSNGIKEVVTHRGSFRVGDWVTVSLSLNNSSDSESEINQYPHKILRLAKDHRYDTGFKARLGGNPDCPHCQRQEQRKTPEPFYTLSALTPIDPTVNTGQEQEPQGQEQKEGGDSKE